MEKRGKLIIFSAPSGSGKSTIIQSLLNRDLNLSFSISATSRAPRGTEQNGVEYYFITPDEFRQRIANEEFLEYEEVYAGKYYGTLKSEVERILNSGKNVIFDVDVVGGLNIKKYYGNQALALFIQPPSVQELEKRLKNRATDAPDVIASRIAKAEYELSFAPQFDKIIVNDILEKAQAEAYTLIRQFLDNPQ
ncbi:MAG TPA: guanylate kinase [Candidatus Barnesiella excrementigallinarum]|nr:guanylate kinase [Candidatus Barnesiella excrementigallinarum]